MRLALLFSMLASPFAVSAQNAPKPPRPIQDNSFLIEEAYNQEKRVVQHIGTLEFTRGSATVFEFTQEWPLGGLRHQLSFAVPIAFGETTVNGDVGESTSAQVGDIELNYRYQLRGDGDATIAVSPRLSVVLPTREMLGFEAFVPASVVIARQLVAHSNAGVLIGSLRSGDCVDVPAAEPDCTKPRVTTVTLGQSLIWLAHPNLNLLVEGVWTQTDFGGPIDAHESTATVSPGVRGAINLKSGMQIVPGFAFPIGFGPSKGERSVFLYLSVEHSF